MRLPLVPLLCGTFNGFAVLTFAVIGPGLDFDVPLSVRGAFISDNLVVWRAAWLIWMPAGLSLLGLFFWWAARIGPSMVVRAALVVGTVGLSVDLLVDSLFIVALPERLDLLPMLERASAVSANGLYGIAGALLTARTRSLTGWALVWTWTIWIVDGLLAVAGVLTIQILAMVSTAVLFALFVPWCFRVAPRLR